MANDRPTITTVAERARVSRQTVSNVLNAPHRVENLDELSISMTIEYSTADIRRRIFINGANGILRQKLKVSPKRNFSGASFWAKTIMYGAVAKSGLLQRERSKRR